MAGLKDQRIIDQGYGVGSRLGYISVSVSIRVRLYQPERLDLN